MRLVSDTVNQTTDRFHLARRHASINLKARGREYHLQTRMHLVHYAQGVFLNVLYLTPLEPKEMPWLAGFNPTADEVCPFRSKNEVAKALNCFLDAAESVGLFGADTDILSCRRLLQAGFIGAGEECKESLQRFCSTLNINILADQTIFSSKLLPESSEKGATTPQEGVSLSLTIGDAEITDGLLSLLRIGGWNAEDALFLTLDPEHTAALAKVDYCDDIKLNIDVGKGWESVFGGIVDEANYSDNRLHLVCRSYAQTLEDTVIQGLIMRVSETPEEVYFLLRSSGWPADKLNIDGLDTSGRMRFYLILAPLANIEAEEPFGIGDVNFSKLEQEHEGALKSLNPECNPNFPDLGNHRIWARVYVPAPHFYEAQLLGIERIDMALDLLANVKSDSEPLLVSREGYVPLSWSRLDRFNRILRQPWIYIQDLATTECMLANVDIVMRNTMLRMTDSLRSRLDKGTEKLQILSQKSWEDLTSKEKGLVYASHWLHRAWDEGSDVDKLMYLWNAIEFVSAAAKPPALFAEEETKAIAKLVHSSVSSDDLNKDQKARRLDEVLGMLNNPSLLNQLRQLLDSADIVLNEEEWEHIRDSRRKRNKIIHGRSNVSFDDSEARKLSFIVSKIISGLSSRL